MFFSKIVYTKVRVLCNLEVRIERVKINDYLGL